VGVHDADYKKVKKLLNVPEDEPIFIVRGQDDLACAIVTRYENMARQIEDPNLKPAAEWYDNMADMINEFANFRNNHPDRIKIPD
jgi:hypothetical protein